MKTKTDITCLKERSPFGKEAIIMKTRIPDYRATLATELLARWGCIAAMPDGEDSAGRQKLRLIPPQEVVKRACDIAGWAIDEMEFRGWYLEVPTPEVE
jgi:hypothetical protein